MSVDPHVVRLTNNRVNIDIEIREGKTTRIKGINIVGNTKFTDKQLRSDFESDTPNWTSWYTKDDQYSRAKVAGDLEKLGDYYLDRGYADFAINSTQVAVTPDKRNMYITASIKEGEVYKISAVHLVGKMVLPEKTLREFVYVKPGDTFNRARIQASAKAMQGVLANIGYAYAEVKPEPKLDKKDHTVDLTFHVQPGDRIYVRRIIFRGNVRTDDEVLRREMRQLEGSWYSQAAVDRSATRLRQLGYLSKVDIQRQRVTGSPDEVDLIVNVTEISAGSVQFGVGYSQYAGVILSASVAQKNFLGTGDSFSLGVQHSRFFKGLNARYVNPYVTDNGISIGYDLSFSQTDFDNTSFANYQNNLRAFSTFIGIPISETDRLTLGAGWEKNDIDLFPGYSPPSYIDYQNALGTDSTHTWKGRIEFTHDTRNAYWAPTRGGLQQVGLRVALPGSSIEYWKAYYNADHYWPIGGGFVLYLKGALDYGDTYGTDTYKHTAGPYKAGDKVGLPFWENFFSGGVQDVRGFQQNSLGPREQTENYTYPTPIGGAFKVLGSAAVYLPLPFLRDIRTARVSVFTDIGNVYTNYDSFDAGTLRQSVGMSLEWHAPIGPLIVSYAIPIRTQPGDSHYEERFQFTFGTTF